MACGQYSTPIRSISHSTLDGLGDPEDNVIRAKELGMKALGLSDHGTISGLYKHYKACKRHGIKPIFGTELYVCLDHGHIKDAKNRWTPHMVVWCKNKQGWQDLMSLSSYTYKSEIFYYKPRISLWNSTDETGKKILGLEAFCKGNIQGFSGHQGSLLSDNLFCDLFSNDENKKENIRKAYNIKSTKDLINLDHLLKDDWFESTCDLAIKLQNVFGKGNFFIELQNEYNPEDKLPCIIHPTIVNCLRKVSKETDIPAMASSDPHYPRKENAEDQRMLIAIQMKRTEDEINQQIDSSDETDLLTFFGNDSFYIHSFDEMSSKFTPEELALTNAVADQIESFDITNKPQLPKFDIPKVDYTNIPTIDGVKTESDKYLLFLALEGIKKLEPWSKSGISKDLYWERLKEELKVICEAGLTDYFLIVHDICLAADNRPADHSFDWKANLGHRRAKDPITRGVGRGSAAGCLLSYTLNITGVDPLVYGLLFARFYNAARNTKDHVSLPDIDMDFSIVNRDWVFEYIQWKYGKENVGKISTFGTIKGRASVKDIMRVKGASFELANEMTKYIPDEAAIADELQVQIDAGNDDYGIIKWTLDHSEEFMEFYKDPKIKTIIDQAMRLEDVIKSRGKHPAGIVIMPNRLDQYFPTCLDTHGKETIIAFDMHDVEAMGGVKMDILGTAILDKLQLGEKFVNERKVK